MLVLSRKAGEGIDIGNDVHIKVVRVAGVTAEQFWERLSSQ